MFAKLDPTLKIGSSRNIGAGDELTSDSYWFHLVNSGPIWGRSGMVLVRVKLDFSQFILYHFCINEKV